MGRGRGETQLTYLCGSRVLASLGLRGWACSLGKHQPWRVLSRPHPTPPRTVSCPFPGPLWSRGGCVPSATVGALR